MSKATLKSESVETGQVLGSEITTSCAPGNQSEEGCNRDLIQTGTLTSEPQLPRMGQVLRIRFALVSTGVPHIRTPTPLGTP